MNNELFPTIKRSIQDYLTEEEGNISRNKLLKIGSMVLLMGILFMQDAFAGHASHSSHSSHSSGSSGYDHSSHASHESHTSHSSGTDGYSSHSSGSTGYSTPSGQGTQNVVATPKPTPEPMPSVPTPHIPPQNDFTTGTSLPQQPSLTIPDTPTITAAIIPPEETSSESN